MMRAKQGLPDDLNIAVQKAGGELLSKIPQIGIVVAASEAEGFAEQLAKHKAVQVVLPELNVQWIPKDMDFHQSSIGGNETLYGFQWNMPAIDAPGAWDVGYTGAGAMVADLDSGIDIYHPNLVPNIDFGASRSFALDWMWLPDEGWIPQEPFIDDLDGHGTWTAGIIAAADNEIGVPQDNRDEEENRADCTSSVLLLQCPRE